MKNVKIIYDKIKCEEKSYSLEKSNNLIVLRTVPNVDLEETIGKELSHQLNTKNILFKVEE